MTLEQIEYYTKLFNLLLKDRANVLSETEQNDLGYIIATLGFKGDSPRAYHAIKDLSYDLNSGKLTSIFL